jgi:hypothetical protein
MLFGYFGCSNPFAAIELDVLFVACCTCLGISQVLMNSTKAQVHSRLLITS